MQEDVPRVLLRSDSESAAQRSPGRQKRRKDAEIRYTIYFRAKVRPSSTTTGNWRNDPLAFIPHTSTHFSGRGKATSIPRVGNRLMLYENEMESSSINAV
ncbi:hypothetical protein DAPPUDRAFT_238505 [Daphnia pulex]|uniref:Uncharacterized protein n=1 Tax=Daphnia pulex TaxID=6669 RepID=E9G6L1_DAPPU|nr:hypothetical protein DAPPUDRAFT_238505 [Daphnia pulex]|eukprot:EFX84952.1 hypothetical protein DAPPUDRAFT_238505 [Daphnia pulex]